MSTNLRSVVLILVTPSHHDETIDTAFGLQRLELIVAMEKQMLLGRGIMESERPREPTQCLDATYRQQSNELIDIA
jgi:hypothetical protein